MILLKKINRWHLGVIIASLAAVIFILYHIEEFHILEFLLLFFLPVYLLQPKVKNKYLKIILISAELIWILLIALFLFYLPYYKAGDYIFPLLLLLFNLFFRFYSLLLVFTSKNKLLLSIFLTLVFSLSIYWFGVKNHLSIGF